MTVPDGSVVPGTTRTDGRLRGRIAGGSSGQWDTQRRGSTGTNKKYDHRSPEQIEAGPTDVAHQHDVGAILALERISGFFTRSRGHLAVEVGRRYAMQPQDL